MSRLSRYATTTTTTTTTASETANETANETASETDDDVGALPMELWALANTVLDDDVPMPRRIAALRRIERSKREHRGDLARLIVSALHGPPDFASQVHLTLLVLERDLAVARSKEDGRLIASAHTMSEAHDDGVCASLPDVGRVVRLDALASLFDDNSEDLPPFLALPDRAAPAPYRPSPRRLAELAEEAARQKRRERMQAIGLDPDDLDDDAPAPKVSWVERLRAPTVATVGEEGAAIVIDGAVRVGEAHPGVWWADERVGDHRQARRWLLRLDRAAPSGDSVLRRERALTVRRNVLCVRIGVVELERRVKGRNVVAFVEEERGLVVAVTITWSTPVPIPKKVR